MSVQSASTQNVAVAKRLRTILEKQLQEAAAVIAERHIELGRRIKYARDQKHWKQKELAAAVSVEPVTVSRWERGVHAPDMGTLYLIAEKTGQPLAHFVSGLDLGGEPPALTSTLDVLERRLAELEAKVDRLDNALAEGVARLAGAIAELRGERQPLQLEETPSAGQEQPE